MARLRSGVLGGVVRGLAPACLAFLGAIRGAAQDDSSQRLEALERRVAELAEELARLRELDGDRTEQITDLQERLDEALLEAQRASEMLAATESPGLSKGLVAGDAFVSYDDDTAGSGFMTVGLNPHLFWKVGERTLLGSGIELELGDGETEVFLEWAQVFYDLGEHATLGLGKSLMPFGYFQENIHSAYINKLPDEPFAVANKFETTLAPTHDLGVQVRGPLRVGSLRCNYVVYLANGPELDLGTDDPDTAGSLDYENFHDSNSNKALGGRIGIQPLPELELGYSALVARVGPDGTPFRDVDAVLQDVDLNYVGRIERLRGNLDVRAEWVWADVDAADFGAGLQENDRSGGYVQCAYRPTELGGSLLPCLEAVCRYDHVDQPTGSALADTTATTLGLNYWAGPTSVFKLAFQDQRGDEHALLLQYALGF